ncbi:MAG: ribbon-helix-helix protein, CopG family [Terriglobia bacterium]|jgi:metal-responsive CopG/Arc/MetJ family transcriptional regulator
MKAKTSITLSGDILAKIDRLAGAKRSRSAFIERVLRRHLAERARAARNARDLELINKHAEELNAEVEDVLRYQTLPEDE